MSVPRLSSVDRDLVLAEDEHADNIMLCVSRARSPEIAIDR